MSLVASLLLAALHVSLSAALQWTSAAEIPANSTVHACVGDDVTLLWKYETEGAEHTMDVEWLFQPRGQVEVTIASYIRGNFFVTPTAVQHVQFLPSAGLEVMQVTRADSGAYTVNVNLDLHGSVVTHSQRVVLEVSDDPTSEGGLHVQLLPGAVQNNVTGEWHVRLSCGTFSSLDQPPVSVLWSTPADVTVASSYYDKAGNYILVVDNPVATGQYTCRLQPTPSSQCLPADSPLRQNASLHVDGLETRLSVLEGQLLAVQKENTELRSELDVQRQENTNVTQQLTEFLYNTPVLDLVHKPANCLDVRQYDATSGIHTVYLRDTGTTVTSYCDQVTDSGGWTVIQRRQDGSVDFYRGWDEYERGFGDPAVEFWLGLSSIYRLTNSGNYSLRIDLEDFDSSRAYAAYDSFRIAGPSDNYRLHISGYSGTAGDSITHYTDSYNLNNQSFSTYDRDHDSYSGNCASYWHGAWWYNSCTYSTLNGRYYTNSSVRNADGVNWYFWKNDYRPYKRTEMKIRPRH